MSEFDRMGTPELAQRQKVPSLPSPKRLRAGRPKPFRAGRPALGLKVPAGLERDLERAFRMAMRPTALFLDVGGVLLTNGWDRRMRRKAAETFHLDQEEMDERHHLTFDTYELGKLTLDEYLNRMVFYTERSFPKEDFKAFMFEQSQPFHEMIDLIRSLKKVYGLRVAVVSNEGRELTTYRIRKFGLEEFVDFFIASAFVHLRKPDADIYRLALDVAQVPAEEVVYIEDRLMFVEVARGLGIRSIHHTACDSTRASLASLGLVG